MNEKQINRLLDLLGRTTNAAVSGNLKEMCSMKTATEMKRLWAEAALKATDV
jgi:hypothetical protein